MKRTSWLWFRCGRLRTKWKQIYLVTHNLNTSTTYLTSILHVDLTCKRARIENLLEFDE